MAGGQGTRMQGMGTPAGGLAAASGFSGPNPGRAGTAVGTGFMRQQAPQNSQSMMGQRLAEIKAGMGGGMAGGMPRPQMGMASNNAMNPALQAQQLQMQQQAQQMQSFGQHMQPLPR